MSIDSPREPKDMPGFKVRYSKFRHVYGQPFRKEQCYESIVMSKNTADGNYCAVNPKYLAIVTESGGGGSFIVVPIEHCGRIDPNYPRVCGHSSSVLDLKWYPFDDNIIASCSEDGSVIIWEIPETNMEENLTEHLVKLRGHGRKCGVIEWHPTASFILASAAFDGKVIVWNVEREEPITELLCGKTPVLSISFNWDGSLLAASSKDKKLRIFDPRTGDILQEGVCHAGTRSTRCAFVGDTEMLITVGTTRGSERELSLWNQHDISAPIARLELGYGTGVLYPFVDHDSNVVFVAGKGDGNIRFYEVLESSPHLFELNQYASGNPQRGLGFMPKRGINTANCEIMRFYKVHANKNFVEPISMIVPRRYEALQKDLYPDTLSSEAALTASEWISGINRPPILVSLGGVSRKVRTQPPPSVPTPKAKEERYRGPPKTVSKPRTEQSSKVENHELKEEPVEVKKPRQELPSEPPLERKEESKELEQWDIIEEEVVTASTNDAVESMPPVSSGEDGMEVRPESNRSVNGTEQNRQSTLTGMEGSLSLSQRLARWENNKTKENGVPPKVQAKPEKRTRPRGESVNSPDRKPKAKVERSMSHDGKETIRIEMDDSISILPSKTSSLESHKPGGLVLSPGLTTSSKETDKDDITDRSTAITKTESVTSRSSSSKETNDLLTSKEMGADQIRKAYLRQKEEIKQLKSQLRLKDVRIRQLEKELEQYTASNC
ncbi:coronin-2B-like isoform X2 [Apostichopus japonicus]|uniref:coronin-2B-like isoform X2 n=2 Tax=Stichopus japonicus TaxID=307972 RepID=UPI003AB8B7B1